MKDETLMLNKILKDPIREHVHLLNNHFSRYNAAIRAVHVSPSDIVMDASCGQGYGAYLLSLKASKVIGLDVNRDYLDFASHEFKSDNLFFYDYDQFDQMVREGQFGKIDKLISIETIEHIEKCELRNYVNKILSYLKKGGSLFVTFPLGLDEPSSYNPFHLNEPRLQSVQDLFSPFFTSLCYEIDTFNNSFGYKTIYGYLTLKNYGGTIS
jgi:O-antigen biosynthesis protein